MAATKSTTLFTLEAVKSYLDIKSANTEKDDAIVQIADGVSHRIETMCGGRAFVNRVRSAETYTIRGPNGSDRLMLRGYPASTVTLVRRRSGLDQDWETLDPASYALDSRIGVLYLAGGERFYPGPMAAEVSYTVGFGAQGAPTLPPDVVHAALEYVKFAYKRWQAGLIFAGSSSSGESSVVVVPEPPKDVRDAVAAWRQVRM